MADDDGPPAQMPTGVPPTPPNPEGPPPRDPHVPPQEPPPDVGGVAAALTAPYGQPGHPIRRTGPLYVGFVGAIGALLAFYLLQLLGELSQVLTLVGVSAFLAMGLDPLVRFLQRRGLRRGQAVMVVFLLLLLVVSAFASAVLPVLITQITDFSSELPDTIDSLQNSRLFRDLEEDYGIITEASAQLRQRLTSGETVTQLFGGLLGAGRAVLSGFASTITVLVLTLYFLASLPHITDAGYRLVPASRRPRVRLLGDEIIRRIGGYVAGQTAVAFINGALTFIILMVVGVPYAAVLAITVGLLGLIPLIGATLGAVVVVLAGLAVSWQVSVGLAIYYLIYQQVENYVIAPRIMARTVSVPGAIALIAALAGGSLLGILGALIAIPIAAGLLLIIQEVILPRQERL